MAGFMPVIRIVRKILTSLDSFLINIFILQHGNVCWKKSVQKEIQGKIREKDRDERRKAFCNSK